ncbi:hypothetical protein NQ317_019271 [Molorchus minor]|uniref:Zinc finger CCHC domain-containing protein 7 n=1 Tax=Molorchus minor TaxID=1323400 RepID=A0ABQ9JXM4_9CUCU|nr:hypothetical protein NQ317_019271 [Molorchus minor]
MLTGDFVKPAKPVDNDCETESSCSTNEVNRTFNNTVKTIVFDEVDFPKEDIFSEKNLESFGSYITPNRNTKTESADIFEISSSDSSTEGPAVVKEKQAKKKHKKKKTNSTETVKDKSLIRKKAGFGTATSEVVESNSTLSTSQKKKKKSLISRHEEVSNDIKNVSDVMIILKNENNFIQKRSKKRKKSSLTSSNKAIALGEEYIEVDLTEQVNVTENNICEIIAGSCDSQVNDHLETSSKSSTSIEEKQICDVENKTQSKENSNQNMSQPISVSNAVANQKEVNNCDIIVVDNSNLDLSSFIVIDGVNSTTICEERVQLISDSEDICNDEVENNLVLANCSTKVNHSDVREDVVAVDDSDAWQISYKDRAIWMNIDRPKKARCNKCRQFGHIALHCTEKWEPPKCSLCGNPGHLEPRCKNKICTQCGNEGDYSTNYCGKCFRFRHSICRICKMKGHLAKTCPDLWRRYHLTTEEGPIVVPQVSQQQPSHKQWCSGCAKQGHLEHECTYYNRVYPPSNPYIMSYEDVLYDGSRRLPQEYISNQNVTPSSSSYGLTMPPTPKPPSFSQQERIIISTGLNCIVEVNSSKPSKILNEMRLNYLKESPQDVGVLTQIKLKNALER